MDPVRGPGTTNPLVNPSEPWSGNMLNDRDDREALDDDFTRMMNEDSWEFSNSSDEGPLATEFLEPGDLVALPR